MISADKATLKDLELMELHADVLFTHDAAGRIVTTNEPEADRAPRLFVGRTRDGVVWRLRNDLPKKIVAEVQRVCRGRAPLGDASQPASALDALRAVLTDHAPITNLSEGPAWRFPDRLPASQGSILIGATNTHLLREHFPYVAEHRDARWPCAVMVVDGMAVSICLSARISPSVAEAGVYTVEKFRGRGYAMQVVPRWATEVRQSGRIPLYSTSWDNTASRRLASKLALVPYGADLSLT